MNIQRQPAGEVVHTARKTRLVKVIFNQGVFVVTPFTMGWADKDQAKLSDTLSEAKTLAAAMSE